MSIDATLTQGQNVGSVEKTRELSRGMLHAKGYELVSELGTGTYGVVWLAKDTRTSVMVAIKFFARGTGEQWESLQEEVKQLAQLHAAPNIVRLMDVESETWPPYFVMDYAEQGSLSARLKRGNIPIGEAVEMFRQIAQALAYVHAKGILHCDLKPGNILLDATSRALVADFGQAHFASDMSPALGTFFYMAPEQADLSESYPDTRWDVYAMGAILYAMLTGRPPREDSTLKLELENTAELSHRLQIYQQKVKSSAKPLGHRRVPGVDRSLAEIVDRCLELDPEKRFRDAQSVLNALRRRDRQKRQRSLIAFGMLVPIAIVLLMSLLARTVTEKVVDRMEHALAQEITKSVALKSEPRAKEMAEFVKDYFTQQSQLLAQISADAEFLSLVKFGRDNNWSADKQCQDKLCEFMAQQKGRLKNSEAVVRWSFTSHDGVMRGETAYETRAKEEVLGRQFSFRDWFNGDGDKPEDGKTVYAPLRSRQHISQPFFGKSGFASISVSVPVWERPEDADDSDVLPIGVMAIAVKLDHFHQALRERLNEVADTEEQLVIYTNELRCVYRRSDNERDQKTRAVWYPREKQPVPVWRSDFLEQCQKAPEQSTQQTDFSGYQDPIDQHLYLAAANRIDVLDWIVVVQRERESAMKIGDELRAEARTIGLWGTAGACLLVPGAWAFLLWIIRREEQADG